MSGGLHAWADGLPAGWRNDWLKWSVRLSTARPTEEERESLPYISNEDIESWTGVLLNDKPQPADSDARKFHIEDVLFNKLRPYLAKVYHAKFDGTSSGELLCLRPSDDVLPRYLFYVLVSKGFIDVVDAETFGSKMPRADWEIVGHQPLPLPSVETQRRIATFLDDKISRIDTLIARKRALLERLAEKRQALITRAVTKGLNPDAPMKPSGIDWLVEIPAHWGIVTLNKITTKITNGYVGPTRDIFVEDGVRYIQSLHIKGNRIIFGDDFFVERSWSDQHAKSILCTGDVLIVQTGDIGQVAVVTPEYAGCNCHALIICSPIRDRLEGRYLSWLLNSDYGQEFLHMVKTGALHPHLNCGHVKFFGVLVPPLMEQLQIADFIDHECRGISGLQDKVGSSLETLSEYRAALITAAVTGQIAELR
jgi:type I restriction enzyme S subunit